MPNLPLPSSESEKDPKAVLGDGRGGVFLFGADDPDVLKQFLAEIPETVEGWLSEIVVMLAEPQPAPRTDSGSED